MWAAIQSDLLDFVTTIKEDTAKVISKASGEADDEEDETLSLRQKLVQDVKRSFDTYGTPVDEQHTKEFEKFMRQFSLSSQGVDIAQLLDDEPDVSRFYAELVPIKISPELFWARYFFRLQVVTRGSVVNLDEDEDEELPWESSSSEAASPGGVGAGVGAAGEASSELAIRVVQLEAENAMLKDHVKTLVARIKELENGGGCGGGLLASASKPPQPPPSPQQQPSPSPSDPPPEPVSPSNTSTSSTGASARLELASLDSPGDGLSFYVNVPASAPTSAPAPATATATATATTTATATATATAPTVAVPRVADLAALDEEEDEDWG